jgi:hypothetical protein
MIVAKISPAATKIIQTSPFEHTTLTGEYMCVSVAKYVIGSLESTHNDANIFEVKFGNIKYEKNPDGSNGRPMMDTVISHRLQMTTPEVEGWGHDDSVLIDLIAAKLNLSVVEKQTMDMSFTI